MLRWIAEETGSRCGSSPMGTACPAVSGEQVWELGALDPVPPTHRRVPRPGGDSHRRPPPDPGRRRPGTVLHLEADQGPQRGLGALDQRQRPSRGCRRPLNHTGRPAGRSGRASPGGAPHHRPGNGHGNRAARPPRPRRVTPCGERLGRHDPEPRTGPPVHEFTVWHIHRPRIRGFTGRDRKRALPEPRAWNPRRGTSTRNAEPRTSNRERGTGNPEPVTRNRETLNAPAPNSPDRERPQTRKGPHNSAHQHPAPPPSPKELAPHHLADLPLPHPPLVRQRVHQHQPPPRRIELRRGCRGREQRHAVPAVMQLNVQATSGDRAAGGRQKMQCETEPPARRNPVLQRVGRQLADADFHFVRTFGFHPPVEQCPPRELPCGGHGSGRTGVEVFPKRRGLSLVIHTLRFGQGGCPGAQDRPVQTIRTGPGR